MSFGMTRSAPLKRSAFKTKPDAKGLTRTGFQRKTPLSAKAIATKPATDVVAKPKPIRKMRSSKPQATAAEKRHMGKVAEMGCVVCDVCYGIEGTPAIVHHLRTGQGKMRASNMNTLPLCPHHHQDSGEGVHDMGRPQFAALHGKSEVELMHIVQTRLGVPLFLVGADDEVLEMGLD